MKIQSVRLNNPHFEGDVKENESPTLIKENTIVEFIEKPWVSPHFRLTFWYLEVSWFSQILTIWNHINDHRNQSPLVSFIT